jgi:hypothetical protein
MHIGEGIIVAAPEAAAHTGASARFGAKAEAMLDSQKKAALLEEPGPVHLLVWWGRSEEKGGQKRERAKQYESPPF